METIQCTLENNWFFLVQTLGIIATIAFATHTIIRTNKSTKLSNLLEATKSNRELLLFWMKHPAELGRVFDKTQDEPLTVTPIEEAYLNLFILHFNTIFAATRSGAITRIEGLDRDVEEFFGLPIPYAVWQDTKQYQNKKFVSYVDGLLRNH